MRKVATFEKREDATAIFFYLQQIDVDAEMEEGEEGFDLWIRSEDQIPIAKKVIEEYEEKGAEALASTMPPKKEVEREVRVDEEDRDEEVEEEKDQHQGRSFKDESLERVVLKEAPLPVKIAFYGFLTRVILIICAVFFFISTYQTAQLAKSKKIESNLPVLTPINQLFIYDYPAVLKAIEQLVDQKVAREKAMEEKGEDVVLPPTEDEKELTKIIETSPIWVGYYNVLLHYDKREILLSAPMFTSIKQGQVWRIFTPILLHAGILHFLFNMLWLWVLGKMIEGNMSVLSFIMFILVTAAVTNTLQYLMTGPFFMGISGVLCAMAGYIWSRKKVAPWEIYAIDRGTLLFLGFFIFGLLGVQIVTFYLQMAHDFTLPLNFANTAHISGVFLGLALGYTKLFQKSRG